MRPPRHQLSKQPDFSFFFFEGEPDFFFHAQNNNNATQILKLLDCNVLLVGKIHVHNNEWMDGLTIS
jgi:hypothetical protein